MSVMPIIVFEEIEIQFPALEVSAFGEKIHLTLTELRVLLLFLSDPHRAFALSEMAERLDLSTANNVRVKIATLQKKLGQRYIRNVGLGAYAFADGAG